MAQERLQIRLDAVDNTKRAFNNLKSNTDSAKASLLNLRNVLIGLGAGVALRSIVNVGKQVESLGLRFKFLFGSASEGAKAFDVLAKFASKVPFSLEEISGASGNLAVISKDANELAKILEITGNVASVTGLDFQTTASQIQRSFAGGIASADIFREKGVRSLLGFSAGATVSAEDTAKKFEEVFGKGGQFGNATAELATTFEGVLSMLGDKSFAFKKKIDESGFFEAFKTQFRLLDQFLSDNAKALDDIAQSIGEALAEAVRKLGRAIVFVYENFDKFLVAIETFIAYKLITIVTNLGEAFIVLAGKITTATTAMEGFNTATAGLRKLGGIFVAIFSLGGALDKFRERIKKLEEQTKKAKEALDDLGETTFEWTADLTVGVEEAYEILHEFEHELSTRIPSALEKVAMSFADLVATELMAMQQSISNIHVTIAQGILNGIKQFSNILAEAIILGKDLGNAFKQFVLRGIVDALGALINYVLQKLFLYALEKLFPNLLKGQNLLEYEKLSILRKQTKELQKQLAIKAIMSFFGGGFAEGGFVKGGRAEGGRVQGYRANGGQTSRTNAYMVGERGRELFIPSTDGQIVSNENLKSMGGTNINFTIQATDVKGVKELLIDNRATITNIINSALNQKGKPALV